MPLTCPRPPFCLLRPPPCSGRQVAIDVAEALAYLHGEVKVLHSDLKSRWAIPSRCCVAMCLCNRVAFRPLLEPRRASSVDVSRVVW